MFYIFCKNCYSIIKSKNEGDKEIKMNSVFEKAKENRLRKAEEEALKESTSYQSPDYTPIEWVGIRKDKEIGGRIVGNPYEARQNPWDVKIILYSEILNDNKNEFVKITWPLIEKGEKFLPDPNWILTRLYNAVTDGDWEKYTEDMIDNKEIVRRADGEIIKRKGGKELNVYWKHIHSEKTCFQRLRKENNIRSTDKFPRNVFPVPRVLMNWIDRMDNWCIENKHTKMLSSRISPYTFKNDEGKNITIHYIDRGIPFILYQKIWENVIETRGHWDLDIILKLGSDRNYTIRDSLEDKISEESKQIVVSTPLTEEEKNYEKYDLDEIFIPSSYVKIKNNLTGLFKLVDSELNTTFTEELDELAFGEAKEKATENIVPEESNTSFVVEKDINSSVGETQSQEIKNLGQEEIRRERTIRNPAIFVESFLESLSNWGKLDNEDKMDMIKSIEKIEDNKIVWTVNTKLVPCDDCKSELPNTVLNCPYCGKHFNV